MLVLLPVVAFAFLFLIFQHKIYDWRISLISSALCWGITLTFITEALSIFRWLTLNGLVTLWLLAIGLIFFAYTRVLKEGVKSRHQDLSFSANFAALKPVLPSLLGLLFIVATVGLIAIVAPPNTWDSMTYHMSRVVHWIQNRSVEHYPTSITRQLDLPPGAEFVIMHLQILSGGDRFANLVQWFSMIGCLIGVSLIARQLGANIQGQAFAAVACATLPMGILQSSSTQNDYAISFWLVCFCYYFLVLLKKTPDWQDLFMLGASLGLASLTKATAYFYTLPFLFLLSLSLLQRLKWQIWKPILFSGTLALLLNISHWWRNFSLFGSPLGISGKVVTNTKFGVDYFVANLIRNVGLHLPIFDQQVNDIVENFIYKAFSSIFKIDLNDPNITFYESKFHIPITPKVDQIYLHEDFSGNPIHLFLVVFCIAVCLITWLLRLPKKTSFNGLLASYVMASLGGLFLICIVLKWTGFEGRYHLSLFVLLSAFLGVVLSSILTNNALQALAIVLVLASAPTIFFNASKPLLTNSDHYIKFLPKSILQTERVEQYFSNRPTLLRPYRKVTHLNKARECPDIGLLMNVDSWEYPLWVLAKGSGGPEEHFEHINVSNPTSAKSTVQPYKDFKPCAIVSIESGEKSDQQVIAQEGVYTKAWSNTVWSQDRVGVFFEK